MQPVMEGSLTALGIEVTTSFTGNEWSETQAILDGRTFDLMLWAQYILPVGDLLWVLSAFFRSDRGSNCAGFESAAVDSLLDELYLAEDQGNAASTASPSLLPG